MDSDKAERDKAVEAGVWLGEGKEYLFHAGRGAALYPDAPTRKWRRLRAARGLPSVRLHDLRHTTAMLLREGGTDLKTIQERLRHARMETTTNLYTHKSELVSRAAADQLEQFDPHLLGSIRGQNVDLH